MKDKNDIENKQHSIFDVFELGDRVKRSYKDKNGRNNT